MSMLGNMTGLTLLAGLVAHGAQAGEAEALELFHQGQARITLAHMAAESCADLATDPQAMADYDRKLAAAAQSAMGWSALELEDYILSEEADANVVFHVSRFEERHPTAFAEDGATLCHDIRAEVANDTVLKGLLGGL